VRDSEFPMPGNSEIYLLNRDPPYCSRQLENSDVIFGSHNAQYYNRAGTHLALAKDSPIPRPIQSRGAVISRQHLGDLHHEYSRMG
jgi:hypothetical protein